jgi:hypothetical protein
MITIVHGNMKFCKLSGTCVDAVADDIKDICYEWSDYDDYRWDGSGCSQCGEKYSEDSFGVNVFALITLLLLGLMI